MGFSKKIKEEVLVKSSRCCAVCKEFFGRDIEIHHIKPRSEGGEDSFENAIPLCFKCHSEAGHYYNQHPKGTKYSRNELIMHRDKLYKDIENAQYKHLELKIDEIEKYQGEYIKNNNGGFLKVIISELQIGQLSVTFQVHSEMKIESENKYLLRIINSRNYYFRDSKESIELTFSDNKCSVIHNTFTDFISYEGEYIKEKNKQKIKINSGYEFITKIDSYKEIMITSKVIKITDFTDYSSEKTKWVDEFDGKEIHIMNVDFMRITASVLTEILAVPRYAHVLTFKNCNHIELDGIIFGHTEEGTCIGGVLRFEDCKDISITNCKLFGCGSVGISITNVNRMYVSDSEIYKCSYNLLNIDMSKNVVFKKVNMHSSGMFDLINIRECENIKFDECNISNNLQREEYDTNYLFRMDDNSKNIVVESTIGENNNTSRICNSEKIILCDCLFK